MSSVCKKTSGTGQTRDVQSRGLNESQGKRGAEAAGMSRCRAKGERQTRTATHSGGRTHAHEAALKSKATQTEGRPAQGRPRLGGRRQSSKRGNWPVRFQLWCDDNVANLHCCCPNTSSPCETIFWSTWQASLAVTCFLSLRLPLAVFLPNRTPLRLLFNFRVCLQGNGSEVGCATNATSGTIKVVTNIGGVFITIQTCSHEPFFIRDMMDATLLMLI